MSDNKQIDQQLEDLKNHYSRMESNIDVDKIIHQIENEKPSFKKKQHKFRIRYVVGLAAAILITGLLSTNLLNYSHNKPGNMAGTKTTSQKKLPASSSQPLSTATQKKQQSAEKLKKAFLDQLDTDHSKLINISNTNLKKNGLSNDLFSVIMGLDIINYYKNKLNPTSMSKDQLHPLTYHGVTFQVLKKWSINKNKGSDSYTFKDQFGAPDASLKAFEFPPNQDIHALLPKHSSVEFFKELTGYKYKVYKVDLISGITFPETHYYVILPDKNMALDFALNYRYMIQIHPTAQDLLRQIKTSGTSKGLTAADLKLMSQQYDNRMNRLYQNTTLYRYNKDSLIKSTLNSPSTQSVVDKNYTEHIQSLYKRLVKTRSEQTLKGLEPYQIVALYYEAVKKANPDIQYLLHIKDDQFITKPKFKSHFSNNKTLDTLNISMENLTMMEQITNIDKINGIQINNPIYQNGEALVKVDGTQKCSLSPNTSGQCLSYITLRLYRNKNNVWKIAWNGIGSILSHN